MRLTPFGGSTTDGKGVRVVASGFEDVALDKVDDGMELLPADAGKACELVAIGEDAIMVDSLNLELEEGTVPNGGETEVNELDEELFDDDCPIVFASDGTIIEPVLPVDILELGAIPDARILDSDIKAPELRTDPLPDSDD